MTIFEDLNNDILLEIISYLPINYLISINKKLLLLHNEEYYKKYLKDKYPNELLQIHRNTCKQKIKHNKINIFKNKIKIFKSLLYTYKHLEDSCIPILILKI